MVLEKGRGVTITLVQSCPLKLESILTLTMTFAKLKGKKETEREERCF